MASNTLPPMQSMMTMFPDSLTPGSLFLTRKPMFTIRRDEIYHYKFESTDFSRGYSTLPNPRRATVNVTFNPIKNDSDPYVCASNWLPRFKDLCKGFIARKRTEKLKRQHDSAKVIQRASQTYLDPWLQLFQAIRPTLRVVRIDELKRYLRECIIQIKKLNSERSFIESQLGDVETIMEQSLQGSDKECLSVEGRRSPNIFAKLAEINDNANNENFLKECLDIDLEEIINVKVNFDPVSCQGSKVHTVFELADKLQQKIHEDGHEWQTLQDKVYNLEKEINDLRNNNSNLDITTRTLRGIIAKHDINLQDQMAKTQDYMTLLEKIKEERKTLLNKIKEHEKNILKKEKDIIEINGKCEYYEGELDNKTRMMESLTQEKLRHEKKLSDLEEKLKISLENQSELELTLQLQKTRQIDVKKRLTEQIKNTEEELMSTITSSKVQVKEQNELIEIQEEKIKQYEETIRKLENQIEKANHHSCSDDDVDFERRRLGQKLKNATENITTMKEELKVMEVSNETLQTRINELQTSLENANEETTEQKKIAERYKTQIQSSNSALNDTELKLNRANRERAFNIQKLTQAKEKNVVLEREMTKVQEELTNCHQTINNKNREIESLNDVIAESKKAFDYKISNFEKDIVGLQEKLQQTLSQADNNSEKWKKDVAACEERIECLQQQLDDKQHDIDEYQRHDMDNQNLLKKYQRKINELEEINTDSEKSIAKLRDHIATLQEENETHWNTMTSSGLTTPMDQRLHSLDRNISLSSVPTSPLSRSFRTSTMPTRRPVAQ